MRSELHALKKRADEARRAARLPFSQSEVRKALKAEPYSFTDSRAQRISKRISDWVPEDPTAKARVPRDADSVWALVHLWSHWAGEKEPNQQYWSDLIERAQPAGPRAGRAQAVEPTQGDCRGGNSTDVDDPRLRQAIRRVFRLLHSLTQQGAPQVYVGIIGDWLGEDADLRGQVIGYLSARQLIARSAKPICLTFVPGMPNFELTEKGRTLGGDPM
ncbi:hypothetical protein [Streptomyces bluensis]|uniref:hypothetical protein n=1 Tax=Streptomyces bluensis TaxID=33897 RepID=UPI001673823F|nr:hypothetical protein [Streptomyces bluensis]GGZ93291.1 hypothetical protein GCM10010344_71440 [Streptomyces bluensis]